MNTATPSAESSGNIVIRPLNGRARRFCAELHRTALPTGLFPRLGIRFLETYHASFTKSPYGVALTAFTGEEPVGLLMGTTDDEAHYRWVVRHHGWQLASAGALALSCRPGLAVLFARTRARRYVVGLARLGWGTVAGNRVQDPGRAGAGVVATLTHIAVAPGHQGKGVGSALVDAFVRAAKTAGAGRLRVMTGREGPQAVGFYQRLGWEVTGETVDLDGKPHVHLVRGNS